MKLKHRIFEWKYWHINRKRERLQVFIAARMIPQWLRYWVIITTAGRYDLNDLQNTSINQLLNYVEYDKKKRQKR